MKHAIVISSARFNPCFPRPQNPRHQKSTPASPPRHNHQITTQRNCSFPPALLSYLVFAIPQKRLAAFLQRRTTIDSKLKRFTHALIERSNRKPLQFRRAPTFKSASALFCPRRVTQENTQHHKVTPQLSKSRPRCIAAPPKGAAPAVAPTARLERRQSLQGVEKALKKTITQTFSPYRPWNLTQNGQRSPHTRPRAKTEIHVARSAAELLAHRHDSSGRNHSRRIHLLHAITSRIPSRSAMVRLSLPNPPLPPHPNQPLTTPSSRIFPYSIATGSLCLLFLLIILVLIQQRQLLPGIVVLGSFILFVLFLTGLVETSIQLYGPTGSVNSYCNLYKPSKGLANGEATLAWLETQGICQDWKAAFAFYIVGTVFLLWMMVMAYQVNQDNFD